MNDRVCKGLGFEIFYHLFGDGIEWGLGRSRFILKSMFAMLEPGRGMQLVARLTKEPDILGSIPGPATYFHGNYEIFYGVIFHPALIQEG